MKKIISVLLAICMLVPLFAETTHVSALSKGAGHTHDFLGRYSMNVMHPHDGYFECDCGERLYSDSILMDDCDTCRNILCSYGLHYYTYAIKYKNNNVYGTCYCGETTTIACSKAEYNEHLCNEDYNYLLCFCPICDNKANYYTDYCRLMLLFATGYDVHNCNSFSGSYENPSALKHTGNSHDLHYLTYYWEEHPHSCIIECSCGSRLYLDTYKLKGCEECHLDLCNNGIHYYNSNVSYSGGKARVSCTYCNANTSIKCSYDDYVWHHSHAEASIYTCPLCELLIDFKAESYAYSFEQMDSIVWEGEQNIDDIPTYVPEEDEVFPSVPEEDEVLPSVPSVPMFEDKTFYSYTCSLTGGDHDFAHKCTVYSQHPHKGYYECDCGEKLHFSWRFEDDCSECNRELCNLGIHNYSYSISSNDLDSGYGKCECGAKLSLQDAVYNYKLLNISHFDHIVPCASCTFETLRTNQIQNVNLSIYVEQASYVYSAQDVAFAIKCFQNANKYTIASICTHKNYLEVKPVEPVTPEPVEPVAPKPEKPVQQLNSFSSYVCSVTNDVHDFSRIHVSYDAHPHKGYYECECGEKLFFKQEFRDNCANCKEMLCSLGIHNYSYLCHYTGFDSGYGECVCGATCDFSAAIQKYNELGLDTDPYPYTVPCATCAFEALNESEILQYELELNLQFLSSVYVEENFNYAKQAYERTLRYTHQNRCEHGSFLESKPQVEDEPPYVPDAPDVPETPPSSSHNGNSSNPGSSSNNSQPLEAYYEYDLETYTSMSLTSVPSRDYTDAINDVASQLFLGNYAEKITLGGTIGEILFSLTGLDAYKDFTDLFYNLTHWESSFGHLADTILSAVAILPIVGAFKSADEIALLRKLAKLDPDTIKMLDKIGGVNPKILIRLKELSKADVLKLMTKLDGHALTKHVGNTTDASLKAIRKGTNAISSFYKQDEAVAAVTTALKNPDVMATIAYKMSLKDTTKFAVEFDMGKIIGVKIPKGADNIIKCSKIRIIIQKISDTEFYVKTAFPI